MGQRIEGFREKGARAVIVDDVCTTGASTVQAIDVAREFGFQVVGAMCWWSARKLREGRAWRKPRLRRRSSSIFTASDVRAEHIRQTDDTRPTISCRRQPHAKFAAGQQ